MIKDITLASRYLTHSYHIYSQKYELIINNFDLNQMTSTKDKTLTSASSHILTAIFVFIVTLIK